MMIGRAPKAWRSRPGRGFAGMPMMIAAGLFAWAGVALPVGKAAAGDRARRAVLEVEVKIDAGRERWKNGLEWKDGTFSKSYTLNIPYVAASSLDNVNPYEPNADATALLKAADAQSRAAAIARQDAALLRTMQQIGTECSESVGMSDGQQFDACMQERGRKYAMTADGADITDAGPGFAEPSPDRFQRWDMEWGADGGCGATVLADDRYQAADRLSDMAGPVLGHETTTGASEGPVIAPEMPLTCSSNQILTDVKTKKIYIQSFYMPSIAGHQTIESKLKGGRLEGATTVGLPGGSDMVGQWTVTQWIAGELKGAPLNGHAERAFKIKGDMNGVSLPTGVAGIREIVPDETDPTVWKRQAPNFHETEFVAKVTWRLKEIRP